MRCHVALGDVVEEGALLAHVGGMAVLAPLAGMVRGLLMDGLEVTENFKIGDIDPRGVTADYLTASDKARAIGGGVLEAMLYLSAPKNEHLREIVQARKPRGYWLLWHGV